MTADKRAEGRTSRRPLLVLLLVLGAVVVGVGGTLAYARASQQTAAAVRPTPTATVPALPPSAGPVSYPRPKCHTLPEPPQMLTPQQLANPSMIGYEVHGFGSRVDCVVKGLYVPAPKAGVPHASGKVILVSLDQQWLWAYQSGKLVFANPVTTGREWLWTPQGTYSISQKVADTWFYSPWPLSSPFYYTPEHVDYALFFRNKGYYIHDAPWRHAFGPGTNVPHTSPDGTQEDGSHGCVNMTTAAAKWLYTWADLGTTVAVAN
jgi:lipoprotein-anchoring transpeptidase ErfK/SrfK